MSEDRTEIARRPISADPADHAESFVRYPPGMRAPSVRPPRGAGGAEDAAHNSRRLTAGLDDYRDLFSMRASRMLTSQFSGPVPPGHPLYSQSEAIGALRDKNAALQKENADLRERLERAERRAGDPGRPRPA